MFAVFTSYEFNAEYWRIVEVTDVKNKFKSPQLNRGHIKKMPVLWTMSSLSKFLNHTCTVSSL